MAFTSETKKELENYISGHLPNKEWYESHFYPFIGKRQILRLPLNLTPLL